MAVTLINVPPPPPRLTGDTVNDLKQLSDWAAQLAKLAVEETPKLHFREILEITEPLSLSRWDGVTQGSIGTPVFQVDTMLNASGETVDFQVPQGMTMWLKTDGHIFIRHKGINVPPDASTDSIYGNARVCLEGPATTKAALRPFDELVPASNILGLIGTNIVGQTDHYASPSLTTQTLLQPGYYRLEVWAAAGNDLGTDGLAELVEFNSDLLHHFHGELG